MKVKNVLKICQESGALMLMRDAKSKAQWLSDGVAIYPMWGFPELTPEDIFMLYDVKTKKQEKMVIRNGIEVPAGIDTSDIAENGIEERAERMPLWIHTEGVSLIPYKCLFGLLWMNAEYMKPFDGEEDIDIFVREMPSGLPYFAVKKGFMLIGTIMPYTVPKDSTLIQSMEIIAALGRGE